MSVDINPYEECRLYTSNAERERWESMATLFGIIVSLDALERAYVRESVSEAQYGPACTRLLAQYKTISKLVITSDEQQGGANAMPGIPVIRDAQDFMATFKVSPPVCWLQYSMRLTLSTAPHTTDGACSGVLSNPSGSAGDSRTCLCLLFAIVIRAGKVGG